MNSNKLFLILYYDTHFKEHLILEKSKKFLEPMSLYSFLNTCGPSLKYFIKDVEKPEFEYLQITSDEVLQCFVQYEHCFIYYLPAVIEKIHDYDAEWYKYFTYENSFRITKQNFLETAVLWIKHRKKKTPYLLLSIDQHGITHIEAFKDIDQANQKLSDLEQQNLIINQQGFMKLYDQPRIQNFEPMNFYLKTFRYTDHYSCIGKIPKHGLGEIVRFLYEYDDLELLSPTSELMLKLKDPSCNLVYTDGDTSLTKKSSNIIYIFESMDESGIPIYHRPNFINNFNPTNSLQLTMENLFEILESWKQILTLKPECVVFWQDSSNWIRVEPFENEQSMDQRIIEIEKNHIL